MPGRDHSDGRVLLWQEAKVSDWAMLGHLVIDGLNGGQASPVAPRVYEVEAWPDGIVITDGQRVGGPRWVGWEVVTGIGPPAPASGAPTDIWLEVIVTDGPPVRLGRSHLRGEGEGAIAEAGAKVERLRLAWDSWRDGAWPPELT